jgi:hypothetical protein
MAWREEKAPMRLAVVVGQIWVLLKPALGHARAAAANWSGLDQLEAFAERSDVALISVPLLAARLPPVPVPWQQAVEQAGVGARCYRVERGFAQATVFPR